MISLLSRLCRSFFRVSCLCVSPYSPLHLPLSPRSPPHSVTISSRPLTSTASRSHTHTHTHSLIHSLCRLQEVIGTLVTHIGSGLPNEVDHALDILATLVETRRLEMDRFSVLIKGVLDFLEHLSVGQIRRLYSILSVLAFHDLESAAGVQDEMHTLIRKQLSHTENK